LLGARAARPQASDTLASTVEAQEYLTRTFQFALKANACLKNMAQKISRNPV
jgi:hypothetical protein